jgi:BlaI family penicillinase repressor
MTDLQLTQRELDIMSVLWDLGEASATEVRERLDDDLAYTSVSTMLRVLESKGFVTYRKGQGKTHIYVPVIGASEAGASVLSRIIDKIYGGSPLNLLTHLVQEKQLGAAELKRMQALLKTMGKRKTKGG